MVEKQIAVIVRQYNKEEPVMAVDVAEKAIREPGQGIIELCPSYLPNHHPIASFHVHAWRFMYGISEDGSSVSKFHSTSLKDRGSHCRPGAGPHDLPAHQPLRHLLLPRHLRRLQAEATGYSRT